MAASSGVALVGKLLAARPDQRLLGRVLSGEFKSADPQQRELFTFTGEHKARPKTFPDPRRANHLELTGIILPYFFDAGWLEIDDPLEFRTWLDTTDPEELRYVAEEVMRQHPWPLGFHVPTFFEFVTSPHYLDEAIPTERQVRFLEALGDSAWDWFVFRRTTNLIALCWGKGSGKDWLSACILSYVAYCVGHMLNPWFHFRHIQGEALDCINVAETADLAKDVFYSKLKRMLLRPCFADILDQKPDKDIQTTKVVFYRTVTGSARPLECLRILSLNSHSESVEGKNTFFWVMDEADAFKTEKGGVANAHQMWTKLTTSNRFGDQQIGIVISYPRAKNGFIIPLYKNCGNVGGTWANAWGDLAPTWEVLPWKTYIKLDKPVEDPRRPGIILTHAYTNPIGTINEIPDTSMVTFYENQPDDFRSVYACNPPATEDAFIVFPEKITEAVEAGKLALLRPAATVRAYTSEAVAGGKTHRFVAKVIDRLSLRPGASYFFGGDAGAKQDSFALCMSHTVPPNESGALCPSCWIDKGLRLRKHYAVEAIDGLFLAVGEKYPCDQCGAVPDRHSDFWGVSRPAGRMFERPVIDGFSPNGSPRYVMEKVFDRTLGKMIERQKTEQVFLPLVVEDLLLEWQPDMQEGLVVDFESVTEVILSVHKTGQLAKARFDAWQAEEKLQRLLKEGINADTKQLSNPEQFRMYRNMKDLLYSNLLWLLPNPKRDTQLEELQDLGGKIDHPKVSADGKKGGKDLTDAEAISFLLASEFTSQRGTIYTGGMQRDEQQMASQGRQRREARQARGSLVGGELARLGVRGGRR